MQMSYNYIDLNDNDIFFVVNGDEKVSIEDDKIEFSDYLRFGSHTVDDPGSDELVNIGTLDGGSNPDIFRVYTQDGNMMSVYKTIESIRQMWRPSFF